MSTRLEQDAADALMAHEQREQFKADERARWARAQPAKIVGAWAPTMPAQQKKEHDQYVMDHNLSF